MTWYNRPRVAQNIIVMRETGSLVVNEQIQVILDSVGAQLRDLYGPRLRQLILFGSYARGEAAPESDIDVLVILDRFDEFWREFEKIEEITCRLSLEHDVVISAFPVSEEDYRGHQTPFLLNVHREGIPV